MDNFTIPQMSAIERYPNPENVKIFQVEKDEAPLSLLG